MLTRLGTGSLRKMFASAYDRPWPFGVPLVLTGFAGSLSGPAAFLFTLNSVSLKEVVVEAVLVATGPAMYKSFQWGKSAIVPKGSTEYRLLEAYNKLDDDNKIEARPVLNKVYALQEQFTDKDTDKVFAPALLLINQRIETINKLAELEKREKLEIAMEDTTDLIGIQHTIDWKSDRLAIES